MTANIKRFASIRRIMVASLVVALLSIQPQEYALAQTGATIDTFDSQLSVIVYPELWGSFAPDPNSGQNSDPAVLGGERDLYVDRVGGFQQASGVCSSSLSQYTHRQEPGVTSYSWITWDGPDSNSDPNNPDLTNFSIDLDGYGATGFQVHIYRADISGAVIRINLWDTSGRTGTVADAVGLVTVPGETRTYLFSSFNYESGFDQNSVAAIQLEIDGSSTENLDVRIDWIAFNGPTAVDVTDFSATSTAGDIRVTWDTGSELDLQAFNVQRSDAPDGPYTQVNNNAIVAQHAGQLLGASYSWLDTAVVAGRTYYYKLEALLDGGRSTLLGPVSAKARYTTYLPLVVRH